MRYSTILFDFDGTLTPSLSHWVEAFQHAFAQYKQTVTSKHIVDRCFYRPSHEIIDEFELGSTVKEFKQHVHEGLHNAFQQARLFDGVTGVLEHCTREGIKRGVVTSAPRKIVDMVLSATEIIDYFGAIVTADDVKKFKPHPEPIHKALEELKSSPENCLIFGDSAGDMLAGHAAGVRTALFFPDDHDRYYDYTKLMETKPHHIFHSYEEFAAHLAG